MDGLRAVDGRPGLDVCACWRRERHRQQPVVQMHSISNDLLKFDNRFFRCLFNERDDIMQKLVAIRRGCAGWNGVGLHSHAASELIFQGHIVETKKKAAGRRPPLSVSLW